MPVSKGMGFETSLKGESIVRFRLTVIVCVPPGAVNANRTVTSLAAVLKELLKILTVLVLDLVIEVEPFSNANFEVPAVTVHANWPEVAPFAVRVALVEPRVNPEGVCIPLPKNHSEMSWLMVVVTLKVVLPTILVVEPSPLEMVAVRVAAPGERPLMTTFVVAVNVPVGLTKAAGPERVSVMGMVFVGGFTVAVMVPVPPAGIPGVEEKVTVGIAGTVVSLLRETDWPKEQAPQVVATMGGLVSRMRWLTASGCIVARSPLLLLVICRWPGSLLVVPSAGSMTSPLCAQEYLAMTGNGLGPAEKSTKENISVKKSPQSFVAG